MSERCLPANQAPGSGRQTALTVFAGKPRSNGRSRSMWERFLPAIQAPRFVSDTGSSFFAGKPRSNGRSR